MTVVPSQSEGTTCQDQKRIKGRACLAFGAEPRDAVGHDREQLGDVLCLGELETAITEKPPRDPTVPGTLGSPAP